MGWFPYLFYSTTYVAQVMADELGREPDLDKATRAGSLALLIYSFGELSQLGELTAVAIAAGTLLPYLSSRDRRLLGPSADAKREDDMDEDEVELEHIRELVRQWKAESARQGRPLKLPSSELGMCGCAECSAVHAEEYLDGWTTSVRRDHGINIFHQNSRAGEH